MTPLARLALAYAPRRAHEHWLTLLALDARLAGVVRGAREPMLAQLRLAWWRDRLGGDPAEWPKGEPLLARLAAWGERAAELVALVDGWEALLDEEPDAQAFAQGRAGAAAALAGITGAGITGADPDAAAAAARRWALADLALHLSDGEARAGARTLLGSCPAMPVLGRSMRPLAILAGLSERALRKGVAEALSGPGALLAAIRLGIAGR